MASAAATNFQRGSGHLLETGNEVIRFVDQNQQNRRRLSNRDVGDEFGWRVGITGGMVQAVASRLSSTSADQPEKDVAR